MSHRSTHQGSTRCGISSSTRWIQLDRVALVLEIDTLASSVSVTGSREGCRRYERDGGSVMARYGFRVDYVLDIARSAEQRFDLVMIASFPSSAHRAAFETGRCTHASSESSTPPRWVISSGSKPYRSGRRESHG
jgi:hypothetical protein